MCCVDHLALNLVCPATIVPQAASGGANVALGHGDGLSIVERLDRSEEVDVLLEQVGQLDQEAATVLGRLLSPVALESLSCSGDGNVDILLGSLVNRADDGLIGGVDDVESLALYALDPFVVDEAVWLRQRCAQHFGVQRPEGEGKAVFGPTLGSR